jgi:hypothetical protein
MMQTVTFDSTAKPNDPLVLKAVDGGWDVAFASVSVREADGTNFDVSLVPELGVWDESSWDDSRWADESSSDRLESILAVVSNSSFPKNRRQLTKGQSHQLRDAMILEAHVAAQREVFVTNDFRAFIKQGRREKLEALLQTRILTSSEFDAELTRHHRTLRS